MSFESASTATMPSPMPGFGALIPKVLGTASTFLGLEGSRQAAAGIDTQAAGAIATGAAARAAGLRRQEALNFEALQLEQQAVGAVAASQRAAEEETRKAQLVASRALVLAASAGASDPSIVRLIAGVGAEGFYRSSMALFGGKEQANQLRMGAAGKRYEAEVAAAQGLEADAAYQSMAGAYRGQAAASRTAGYAKAAAGAAGLFAKYGMGGPSSEATTETDSLQGFYGEMDYPG